jgi:hypothetical protein
VKKYHSLRPNSAFSERREHTPTEVRNAIHSVRFEEDLDE